MDAKNIQKLAECIKEEVEKEVYDRLPRADTRVQVRRGVTRVRVKIEPGELPADALKREIREELATEIEVGELLTTVEYDYPKGRTPKQSRKRIIDHLQGLFPDVDRAKIEKLI